MVGTIRLPDKPNVLDVLAAISGQVSAADEGTDRGGLPLVTAAGLSARFPLFTPVGTLTLRTGDGEVRTRFSDGGVYENSGAATMVDLLTGLDLSNVRPIIIQISSDPDANDGGQAGLADAPSWASELMSPLRALLNARVARGVDERLDLRNIAVGAGVGVLPVSPLRRHGVRKAAARLGSV